MFMTIEELRSQIHAFKLDRLEAPIVRLAQPAIRMVRTPVDEATLPLGASRLGGWPDLPPDFKWPYLDTKPLTFMGQFKLSELAPHDAAGMLPSHGMLYFFYDADETLWTDDPNCWKIVYIEDEHAFLVRTAPPPPCSVLPAHRIEYSFGYSLPIIFWSEQADFDINFLSPPGDETDPANQVDLFAYFELLEAAYPDPQHHWLGHPYRKQGYVEWDVVTIREKVKPEKIGEREYRYTDEQIAFIQAEMGKWQFLFQICTDDSLNVGWGDFGTLYICIPKASLAARRFEDCWIVMQCY